MQKLDGRDGEKVCRTSRARQNRLIKANLTKAKGTDTFNA